MVNKSRVKSTMESRCGHHLHDTNKLKAKDTKITGGWGASILKVPGDVPPAGVYFFGLLPGE